MIGEAAREAWYAHARAEYPREAVGLLVGEEYVPCRNQARTPDSHFVLPAEDYADAEDRGEIRAVLHSHPDGGRVASDADRVMCEESQLTWGIVALGEHEIAGDVWIAPCGYVAPLVGRQFSLGILDCYSLIRDCYRYPQSERDAAGITEWPLPEIVLPDYPREGRWWEEGGDMYRDLFADAGFEQVHGEIQIGDVIIMQVGRDRKHGGLVKVPNHAGVYIGGGRMLHHTENQLSTRIVYGGQWQERTRMVVRLAR